ncbi:MAG: 2-amino-4-hydroxy-6-hydroxymethyldihydropteridine diphosphokinase [Crocinitomicaceae bacterium]
MQRRKVHVLLSLGTNLGSKIENLNIAKKHLSENYISVVKESKIYETPPWGFQSANNFYNIVLKVETLLSPFQLLVELKATELKMGRPFKTADSYTSRIIDIDIIDYNSETFKNVDLVIPHPILSERSFVLYPLRDVQVNYVHPITGKTIEELIAVLNDKTATVVNI